MQQLSEYESKKMLQGYGIPVTREIEVDSEAGAVDAARKIGYPVVLKVSDPAILHKTEVGGVILDVRDEATLRAKLAALPKTSKVLVQEQVEGGLELILGGKRDSTFGPVILLGLGGIFTEMLKKTVIRICPVEHQDALSMIDGFEILKGFRGMKGVDAEALARIMTSLSKMLMEKEDISELDINPLIASPKGIIAVDAGIRMNPPHARPAISSADAAGFFEPRSIAVVGTTPLAGKTGHIIVKNLLEFGFSGPIFPVFPRGGEMLGLKCYKSLKEIGKEIDLAVIAWPAKKVRPLLEECGKAGVRNAIVVSVGFSDIGEEGRKDEEALIRRARELGIRIMGPNSIGTINTHHGVCTSIGTVERLRPGGCSFFGQTGVFSSGFANWISSSQYFGVAKVACIGNKADLHENDILDYLGRDPETKVIGLYTEGLKDGREFLRIARGITKPMIVLKSGKTAQGREAIASHTGSLAGDDAVYEEAFREAGLLRVGDFEEFFDTMKAFQMLPRPQGSRLGVVSITGVGAVLTADTVAEFGIELPPLSPAADAAVRKIVPAWAPVKNPIDMWTTIELKGAAYAYSALSEIILKEYDALLVIFVLLSESHFDAHEVFHNLKKQFPTKPIVAAFLGGHDEHLRSYTRILEGLNIPCYPSPYRAIRSLAHVIDGGKKTQER